jgi:homoserine O-acetyltransferase
MASHLTSLIDQQYITLPSFTLDCGITLSNVPVAYKTWGSLNSTRDNVMIICHAFTGSADVEDWWGPLMGRGKAFDAGRFFIFCANVLGSPYGTASPVTLNSGTGKRYGPEFPPTTVRDDVRVHKAVLDELGVRGVAVVIGGSMGGMAVLEWPLVMRDMGIKRVGGGEYVKRIVPLATSARHSAWCISWGEAQRQSIYADPEYRDGYYFRDKGGVVSERQPKVGLAAARMAALLTYRSRDSFESRFGRRFGRNNLREMGVMTPPQSPKLLTVEEALVLHNDGHKMVTQETDESEHRQIFSAQSYLRYQGDKFTSRFDANCYIHITRKLDTHDIAKGRVSPSDSALAEVLSTLPPALVISIATDGLFTTSEQRILSDHIPNSELVIIPSEDGHDGFLLEFERINEYVLKFLKKEFPEYYEKAEEEMEGDFEIKKTSVFGEAEVDVANW